MENGFKEKLKGLLAENTCCVAQHDGWACNTCFHDWAVSSLGLDDDLAHLFWIVVLRLRGDYEMPLSEFLEPNKEFFEQLALTSRSEK